MSELGTQISTGIISNGIFVIIFAIGAWIKSRLGASNCKVDCGWLMCDSSLVELEKLKDHLHETQRHQSGMLKKIMSQMVEELPKEEVILRVKEI